MGFLCYLTTEIQPCCIIVLIIIFFLAVLFGLGDVIAQFVVRKEGDEFDFTRLGRAWVFGTFLLGPLAHLHFNFLEWFTVQKVNSL